MLYLITSVDSMEIDSFYLFWELTEDNEKFIEDVRGASYFMPYPNDLREIAYDTHFHVVSKSKCEAYEPYSDRVYDRGFVVVDKESFPDTCSERLDFSHIVLSKPSNRIHFTFAIKHINDAIGESHSFSIADLKKEIS